MILKYFLIAWLLMGSLLTIANVGKPRPTTTAGVAAFSTLITLAIVAAIFVWWPTCR